MANKKILIVDDEVDILRLVGARLKLLGFDVITAMDGKEGLDKARSEKPDLMILDLMLPHLDGYQVCKMLKLDETYKNIPIILFTAKASEEDKEVGVEAGADAYITKPFEPEILLGKIKELLKS